MTLLPTLETPLETPSRANARSNGLDTLRALAIVLVFFYHYRIFVSAQPSSGWLGVAGWVGVDLFLVLSGYLIGNQLFAGLVGAGASNQRLSLRAFYARRALRTWPAFWVVLAAYFLWPADMGGKTPPPLWQFLTFTQNVALQPGTAFSHAWSLCIEEQFYLVLPLVLLLGQRIGSRTGARRTQAWLLIGGLVLLGIGARAWLWTSYGREVDGQIRSYHPYIYYATLCRFDEFLPGVAVALLKNCHPQWWQRAMQHGQALLAAGLAAVAALGVGVLNFYWIKGYGYGFFMTAFGYSLIAMAFALLVMAALSPASWLHRVRVPGAYRLALWSYSIYLTHKAVGHVFSSSALAGELSPELTMLAITALSLAVGAALYWLVECPFMAFRDQRLPSNFVPKHRYL